MNFNILSNYFLFVISRGNRKLLKEARYSFGKKESLLEKFIYIIYFTQIYAKVIKYFWKYFMKIKNLNRFSKLILNPGITRIQHDYLINMRRNIYHSSFHVDFSKDEDYLKDLKVNGFVEVTDLLNISKDSAEEVFDYFTSKNAYPGQVPMQSNFNKINLSQASEININYLSYTPDISLENVHINKIIKNKKIKKIVDDYLNYDSQIYSVNTMLTLPSDNKHSVTDKHRDIDDVIFLALFIYWTETSFDNGATMFEVGSHNKKHGETISLSGKKGSAFLVDTFGIHSGNKELKGLRLATWIRYGSIPNYTYIVDKNYLYM